MARELMEKEIRSPVAQVSVAEGTIELFGFPSFATPMPSGAADPGSGPRASDR